MSSNRILMQRYRRVMPDLFKKDGQIVVKPFLSNDPERRVLVKQISFKAEPIDKIARCVAD